MPGDSEDTGGDSSWLDSLLTPEAIAKVAENRSGPEQPYDSGWLDAVLTPEMVDRVVFLPDAREYEDEGIETFDVATQNKLYNSLDADTRQTLDDLKHKLEAEAAEAPLLWDAFGAWTPPTQDLFTDDNKPVPVQLPGANGDAPEVDWGALLDAFFGANGGIDIKENEKHVSAD